MHLQSLELFGFKSFADKTLFNFHEGVTAIVGPNGCGKSNVVDAVRWALGEQSAKSLRGDEMADVIFNGADTRKPVGLAEVSLTFTDCAEEFGIDWHDVRVTRRVYRDGNSEYLLNKTPCRLRDIQNLFADTGIARAAYSMMEQGKIDMILSSRPEDRRAVFEEAAGITKYKTQKREALRKLEATEANLLRIGDVIKEVKRQIGTHHNRIQFNRQRAEELTELTERSKKDVAAAETKRAQQRKELDHANALIEKTCQHLQAKEAELAKLADLISKLRSERSAHDSKLEALRSSRVKNEKRIAELEDEISGLAIRRDATEETRRDLDAAISKAHAARDKVQKELADAHAAAETGQKNLDLLKTKSQANE